MVHILFTSHATSKIKNIRHRTPILVNSARLFIKFLWMGSNIGVISAISLALGYLFVVENNTHIFSKGKEVMSTAH